MNSFRKSAAILTAALIALSGCGSQTVTASTSTSTAVVAATAATRGSISRETSYSGRITPGESVYVIGKVSGTVKKTYAEVGDTVNAGDLLYEIDTTDVMLSVNQAKAAYESAQASVDQALGSTLDSQTISAESAYKQAKYAYNAAEDAVDEAEAKLKEANGYQTELEANKPNENSESSNGDVAAAQNENANNGNNDNNEALTTAIAAIAKATGSASVTDYDSASAAINALITQLNSALAQAESAYDQAKIAYTSARTAYQLMTGDATDQAEAAANASLEQAKAAYDAALVQLDYCRVTSPISGIVELKNVSDNGISASSSYAYVISNKDTMCVTFGVPADVARFFEIGDAITLENGSVVHSAEIVEIATMVDSTSGLFTIKANVTDDSSDLLTGIAVKLTATTAHSDNTILIPTAALYYDDGNAYVYLAVDGIAVKTSVTTGIISGDEAEITAGIEDGDLVITTWSTNLRDGAAVTVQEV